MGRGAAGGRGAGQRPRRGRTVCGGARGAGRGGGRGALARGRGPTWESWGRGCLRNVTLGPKAPGISTGGRKGGAQVRFKNPPSQHERRRVAPSDPLAGEKPRPQRAWSGEAWCGHRAARIVPFPSRENALISAAQRARCLEGNLS